MLQYTENKQMPNIFTVRFRLYMMFHFDNCCFYDHWKYLKSVWKKYHMNCSRLTSLVHGPRTEFVKKIQTPWSLRIWINGEEVSILCPILLTLIKLSRLSRISKLSVTSSVKIQSLKGISRWIKILMKGVEEHIFICVTLKHMDRI